MNEKSLLSLREISRELNLKYRTILNLKYQLSAFLPGMYDGRYFKYHPDCIDLFRLVFALREEGYTFEMIRDIFQQKRQLLSHDTQINEWITTWLNRYGVYWQQLNELECASAHQHAPGCTSTHQYAPECADTHQQVLACASAHRSRLAGAGEDQYSQETAGCPDGNLNELIEHHLSQFKIEYQSKLKELLEEQVEKSLSQKISSISSRLEQSIVGMNVNINESLTQIYKAICQLQEGYKALEDKFSQLASDLGIESVIRKDMMELDLDELQIDRPEIKLEVADQDHDTKSSSGDHKGPVPNHADLEFVRASIHDGRPDKTAVTQWILAEKERDASQSYGHLATMLSDAGISTLSGRDSWSRAVVRNLAIKG